MKPFNMLKITVLLLGFGGALLLSPACKAQECSPDHFTDTGIEDVYQPGAVKVAAIKAKPKPAAVQARKHPIGSSAALQLAANRDSAETPQPVAQAVAEKRKPTPKP